MLPEKDYLNIDQTTDQLHGEDVSYTEQTGRQLQIEEPHELEEIDEFQAENTAGGFKSLWFLDGTANSKMLYHVAGVEHFQGTMSLDKYMFDGQQITYKQACRLKRIAKEVLESYPDAGIDEKRALVKKKYYGT